MSLKRAALALLFSSMLSAVAVADGQRVILVLDASGSMWGQINGKAKMDIAKDVVGKVLSTWKPEDDIGLVVYGHREKGSCTDIETIWPAKPLNINQYMSPIKSLSPKGKTPMTQAVRQAAEALKYTEQQSTVILISDGLETCGADPCAVARELEKSGVNLTVHTVGFGLDDEGAIAQLKCMAEETGGISVIADNAEELESALHQTVEAKVEEPPPPPPEPAPAPEPAVTHNFVGHVVMAEGVELPEGFNQPTWEFYRSVQGEKGERVDVSYGKDVKMNLVESGDYIVRIVNGFAAAEFPARIEADKPFNADYSLESGLVYFKGYMDENTHMTDSGTVWEVLTASGEYVSTVYGPDVGIMVNAGNHKIALSLGTAKTTADFSVKAGSIVEQKITLGAGVIEANAVFSEGGQAVPEGATYELLKYEANLDGSFERIETAYAAPSLFKVPAGKYKVAIIKDYAKIIVDAEVRAGQLFKISGNLNAGYLSITSPADSTVEIYNVEKDLAGNRAQIGTEFYGTFNKALTAGTYYVTAKYSDGRPIAEKEFVVKAGARTEGTLP